MLKNKTYVIVVVRVGDASLPLDVLSGQRVRNRLPEDRRVGCDVCDGRVPDSRLGERRGVMPVGGQSDGLRHSTAVAVVVVAAAVMR